MARPHLKISVPKPCSENWNAMTPQAQGRFCESCATGVTDFSSFSEAQLKAYFLQHSGKTCGGFVSSQLNQPFYFEESSRPNFWIKALAFVAVMTGLSTTVQGQNIPENHAPTHQLIQRIRGTKPKTVSKQPEKVSSDSLVISGRLLDANTKEPIAFGAVVVNEDSSLYSQTDIEGKFKIILPDTFLLDEFTLSMPYVGYETGNFLINRSELPFSRDFSLVSIFNSGVEMLGIVVVKRTPGFYMRNLWWKTKNLFRKQEFELPEE